MQQTENYKLNLIEMGDHLSPAPLNENAERIEAALDGQDARITMLEAKHFVFGTYTGDGQHSQFIELGFTPKAVFVRHAYVPYPSAFALINQPGHKSGKAPVLEIMENGFMVYVDSSTTCSINNAKYFFNYIAFA